MSQPINPYLSRLQAYAPAQTAGRTESRPAAETQAAARPAATQQVAAARGEGLSAEEQRVIDRYFPASSAMELRLYGPGRQAHTVNPNAVGTRLDLRG